MTRISFRAALVALGIGFAAIAAAQSTNPNAKVTGRFQGSLGADAHEVLEFSCFGSPTCTGQYNEEFRVDHCSNTLTMGGTITITGLQLGQSGALQGNVTMSHWDFEVQSQSDGTCRIGNAAPASFSYTGHYNAGTFSGTLTMDVHGFSLPGTFAANTNSAPPVFPMTVESRIDNVSATASAAIQFRPQDVGQQASVFVFAMAPASRVQGAESAGVLKLGFAKDEKKADTPIGCVLAQLNAAGQMVAVSSANLAAYLTGVLTSQGASVSILNGVPTSNVSGATFFVGYGSSGSAMINTGVNRAAVTVPGSLVCEPAAPQTGWWWNPLEDGRGFSLEMRGNNLFFAAFLYDVSGRSTWYVSTGPVSLEGTLYNGELLSAAGGQTLGGPYQRFPTLTSLGNLNLTFNNAATGTMVWPGGTVPIQRFNIIPNGLNLPPVQGQPESGWWWNENESGRGFFMEWQNGWLDIAGYMYDDAGNPVWYLTVGEIGGTAANRSFNGTWWSYTGGQALFGPWRQNTRSNPNVAPVTITFSGPDTALMTLPNGRTTNLKRHRF
ncbi:MAG TPA: hypothetical protein VEC19_16100 [Usitatibacter sp.]|nr:hypothetical protein [Usitatibacter sp.]